MKLKSNYLLGVSLALSIMFVGNTIQAQHKHKNLCAKKKKVSHKKVHPKRDKVVHKVNDKRDILLSIKVIKKTNQVIIHANKTVKKNKVHSVDLSKADHHQQYAKRLLNNHKLQRAMKHSRLARNFAFKAIKSNQGRVGASI